MKIVYISSKSKEKLNKKFFLEYSNILPKKIAIAYSIQYEEVAKEIRHLFKKTSKITDFFQVLGCSKIKVSRDAEAILLVGSGRFHALSMALNLKIPIYIYEKNRIIKIDSKDVENFKKRKKTAYLKFLSSENVGILISTKKGQQNLLTALNLKKRINNKNIYFFLGDLIVTEEFENFGLSSWINTACPRLDMNDNSIINIEDLVHKNNS